MSAIAQGGVMLVAGVVILRTVLVEGHLNYVRPGLGTLLMLGAAAIIAVGLSSLLTGASDDLDAGGLQPDGHGHDHGAGRGPKVGWLILIPMLALISTPQVPLGSFAAGLGAGRAPIRRAALDFPPLPEPREGAVDMSISEFVSRSLYAPDSIEGKTVRLLGFVAPDPKAPSGWLLTRFRIGCCAADAIPMQVAVRNEANRDADQWVEVMGIVGSDPVPTEDGYSPPELNVIESRAVDQPENPYEL